MNNKQLKDQEKKYTIIPAGYRITIQSCENDADFGDTTIVEGLSIEEACNVVDLCKLMKDDNYSNLYDPNVFEKVQVFNALNKIFKTVPDYKVTKKNIEEYEGDFLSILSDYGFVGKEDDQFTRYCTNYKVEWFESDIMVEDVTEEFV